ncbi:hypothetical protein NQ314_000137 [Rhamnusium bicolor]|uniref:Serpin domain-containing protein n=1 Tax=Rhamnusium bicolor TaxID=1586634 RepID=A0AAV8ZWP2_9CUCU|nr:hypothetical protein NQ314_000137 [Rhamnusium bicolor]
MTSPPDPSTSALFLNSIYFLAEWKTPFSDELNTDGAFYTNENETVNTTYMLGLLDNIPYVEAKDYRLICLPYKNNDLGMYIIYPNENNPYKYNLKEFSEKLDPSELLDTITKTKLRSVVVQIPKLSLSNKLTLLEPLQKYAEFKKTNLNIKDGNFIDNIANNIQNFKNFTPQATSDIFLTGAAKNANFRISNIVQQMVFSINEKGTEAAAVTSGLTDNMGGSKTMVITRPFAFFIRHEATLATIFWGTIMDPSQN